MRRFAPMLALVLFSLEGWAGTALADGVEDAKPHFQHAKELYEQGTYKAALTELETARSLDPNAKDLVINLGIVSEKLGRIDDALKYFNTYIEMDLTDQERARAEITIKRLRGVKSAQPKDDGHATPPPPPPPDQPPTRGKLDGWTIGAGVLGVGGITLGAIFGIAALTGRPPANFVTGRDGTYAELNEKAQSAHTLAIASDVSFIAGAAFVGLAATLFFARTNTVQRGANKSTVTVTILPSGVAGSF